MRLGALLCKNNEIFSSGSVQLLEKISGSQKCNVPKKCLQWDTKTSSLLLYKKYPQRTFEEMVTLKNTKTCVSVKITKYFLRALKNLISVRYKINRSSIGVKLQKYFLTAPAAHLPKKIAGRQDILFPRTCLEPNRFCGSNVPVEYWLWQQHYFRARCWVRPVWSVTGNITLWRIWPSKWVPKN